MFGIAMVAPHDISGSIEEIRRTVQEYGFRGIFLRPNHVNNKKWSDSYYDPLWAECEKWNLPVGFHEAGRVYLPQPAFFHICSTFSMFNTFGFPFANMLACGDMIFGGVMERFPKLKVAFFGRQLLLGSLAALANGRIRRNHWGSGIPGLNHDSARVLSA